MSKIKLSDSDKRLLVVFLAVLLVAGAYFLVFNKGMSKAAEIEEKNEQDRLTVQNMEMMEANLPQVKENIRILKQRQADIIAKYPSNVTTEKVIYILRQIEEKADFQVVGTTFLMNTPMAVTSTNEAEAVTDTATDSTETGDVDASDSTETVDDAGAADSGAETDTTVATLSNETSEIGGYYASIGVEFEASYDGLKQMIQFFNDFDERITITALTATYDTESGKLTGNLTLNMYYITGTGKEYIEPKFDFTSKGMESIFGGATDGDSQDGDSDEY